MRENKIVPGKKLKFGEHTKTESKLVKRCREAGIEIPSWQPIGDLVLVWRLPPIKIKEGLIITITKDESPNRKGILVAASSKALDWLESFGVHLGDIVIFARYAGEEANDTRDTVTRAEAASEETDCRFITMRSNEIQGSDDLRQDLEAGRVKMVKADDGRRGLQAGPKAISGRKAKLLKLAAADSGASPAERATAQKLAARTR